MAGDRKLESKPEVLAPFITNRELIIHRIDEAIKAYKKLIVPNFSASAKRPFQSDSLPPFLVQMEKAKREENVEEMIRSISTTFYEHAKSLSFDEVRILATVTEGYEDYIEMRNIIGHLVLHKDKEFDPLYNKASALIINDHIRYDFLIRLLKQHRTLFQNYLDFLLEKPLSVREMINGLLQLSKEKQAYALQHLMRIYLNLKEHHQLEKFTPGFIVKFFQGVSAKNDTLELLRLETGKNVNFCSEQTEPVWHSKLPVPVNRQVLSYLNLATTGSAHRVCKSWDRFFSYHKRLNACYQATPKTMNKDIKNFVDALILSDGKIVICHHRYLAAYDKKTLEPYLITPIEGVVIRNTSMVEVNANCILIRTGKAVYYWHLVEDKLEALSNLDKTMEMGCFGKLYKTPDGKHFYLNGILYDSRMQKIEGKVWEDFNPYNSDQAILPDGRIITSLSNANLSVYDPRTHQESPITIPAGYKTLSVFAIQTWVVCLFEQDGYHEIPRRRLCRLDPDRPDFCELLWEVSDREELMGVALTHNTDNQYLAACYDRDSKIINIVDLQTSLILQRITIIEKAYLQSLAWSNASTLTALINIGDNDSILRWDFISRAELAQDEKLNNKEKSVEVALKR